MLFLRIAATSAAPGTETRPRAHSPRQLLREEVIHPREPDQLRQRAREAKRVGQPRGVAALPEPRLEEALPEDHLAREGLARRHVRVVLDPRAAHGVKLPRAHLLLHAREERGVELRNDARERDVSIL